MIRVRLALAVVALAAAMIGAVTIDRQNTDRPPVCVGKGYSV